MHRFSSNRLHYHYWYLASRQWHWPRMGINSHIQQLKWQNKHWKLQNRQRRENIISHEWWILHQKAQQKHNLWQFQTCSMVIKDKEQGLHTLIGIYHLLQGTERVITNSVFITEFTEFLIEATSKHNNILILRDFNIHINDLEDAD